ncbi:hypothetical protein GYMLUDRAFT_74867 [Collybiopsis luxurians FD-317 M1]|uniref:G-protein coupled receptors family 1 profile domain-containing protein n=1 Tax=Collybiopsis luxurians FD-317 M1 TaxID=944289 RepID=A0A0D0C802_9AGAR|nr:hypothetical protein GYMLUDRAFT_74867 [Collybiopsis luxurians FD-317 M1]
MEQSVDLVTLKAFVALELFGGIGMLILLVSALLSQMRIIRPITVDSTPKTINRSLTWFSFCISWIISASSFCLLFFAGKQFDVNELPSYGLCLTQAVLVYASPPLTGATTFALFFEMWLIFRAAITDQRFGGVRRVARIFLLSVPYGFWIVLLVGLFIVGGIEPELVQRDLTFAPYCTMRSSIISVLVSVLELVSALAVLVMLVILVINLFRVRQQISRWRSNGRHKEMMALLIRLLLFGVLGLIAATISTVFIFNRSPGVKSNIAFAVLPSGGALVFGSQKDFLQLWTNLFLRSIQTILPCTRRRRPAQSDSQDSSKNSQHDLLTVELDTMHHSGSETFLISSQNDEEVNIPLTPKRMRINA